MKASTRVTQLQFALSLLIVLMLSTFRGTDRARATDATETATPQATPAPTAVSTAAPKTEFVLADVSDKPTGAIAILQPLADYLSTRLTPYGITNVSIKIAPNYETIEEWLKTGEVDLILQTPYPAVLLGDSIGASSILRRWKGGDAEYYAVIFARADSGLKSLADLKGKMMAVQDQYSTSSYMLPLAYVFEAGLKAVHKPSTDAAIAPDEVGFTDSNSDDNTLQWVISGKVAVGATDNRTYEKIPADARKQLTVLLETEKIPRNLVVLSPQDSPELVEGVKSVLLAMDQTDEGKAALLKFQKTTKFDELPGGADQSLARVRTLVKLLKQGLTNQEIQTPAR